MDTVGETQPTYARVLFVIFAIISASLFAIQILFLQKLSIVPAVLLPLLSFCICFENCVLFQSDRISTNSDSTHACYVFHALEFPLFIVILYELALRLHEARSAHFWCIPFDQGNAVTNIPSKITIWLVRLMSVGLFILSMLASFHYYRPVMAEGYLGLGTHRTSATLWLTMVPAIALSVVGLFASSSVYRYGKNFTIDLSSHEWRWGVVLVGVLCQAIGQIFGRKVFAVTSNAGNLCLLISATWLVHIIQEELILAGAYAEFLHRSNSAYTNSKVSSQLMLQKVSSFMLPSNNLPSPFPSSNHHNHHHKHTTHASHPIGTSSIEVNIDETGSGLPQRTHILNMSRSLEQVIVHGDGTVSSHAWNEQSGLIYSL